MTGVDILISTEGDVREVFGLQGEPPDLAARMHDRYRAKAAIVTAGARGAYLVGDDGVHHERALEGDEVDPVGRGDAFAAGVLWGALEGDLHAGMRYGVALAALAQAYWGDIPRMTRDDVYTIMANNGRAPQGVRR
jgi:2-dehydro-3-deoxygluconokinase